MVDAHKNFAYSVIATAPIPATLGTTLTVTAGQGVLFPTPPFNATIYPSSAQPLSTNSEIVRVTAISIDTFTITRTQESTSARSIVVGDQIAATITAKTLTDVETAFVLKAGDTMTGNLFVNGGNYIMVRDAGGSNYLQFYHTGSYGQIQSSTGFVLVSTGANKTAIAGTNNPQFIVQNVTANYNSVSIYNDDLNGFIGTSDNTGTAGSLTLNPARNLILSPASNSVQVNAHLTLSAKNLVTDTTTGTQIGTATNQKLGFFNSTPVVQQTGDIVTALSNLGLVTSGTTYPKQAPTASAPAYVKGGLYFDTTLNKLRIGGATAWETVTSV